MHMHFVSYKLTPLCSTRQDTLVLAMVLVSYALPLEPLDPEGFGADEDKAEVKREVGILCVCVCMCAFE